MKIKHLPKQQKIEILLKKMETEPMNVHKMAEFLGMSSKSTCKYITDLKASKKIYVAKYERTMGQFATFYMTGNFPDAIKPVAYDQKQYNEKSRNQRKKMNLMQKHIERVKEKQRATFVPRPDVASAWMFNPC